MDIEPPYGQNKSHQQFQTSLLFYDHIQHDIDDSRSTSEITFERPVQLFQLRLVTSGITPHIRHKSSVFCRQQQEAIKNLEIFAKDLTNPNSKYLNIISDPILKDFANNDVIVPIPNGIRTNSVIVRGQFSRLTICMYGEFVQDFDEGGHVLDEQNDIPLEQLVEDQQVLLKNLRAEEHDVPEEHLTAQELALGYFNHVDEVYKNVMFVMNYENIVFALEISDESKRRAIRQNDDVLKAIDSYTNWLTMVYRGEQNFQHTSEYLKQIENLTTRLNDLLESNQALIRLPASFSDNQKLFDMIPKDIVTVCLETLLQKFDDLTEATFGLNLAKAMLNSAKHASAFIERGGLERMYAIVLMTSADGKMYISTKIKLLVLEVLNMCLSYPDACDRFINYKIADPDMKTESTNYDFFKKDSGVTESSTKADKKEKRSRSRKKSSKKKKDKKSKKDRDRSPSKSKSKKDKKKSSKRKSKKEGGDGESSDESRSRSASSTRERVKKNKSHDAHLPPRDHIFLEKGYQKIFSQFNKPQNSRIYYGIRQVLHKSLIYCYLNGLNELVRNELMPELQRIKGRKEETIGGENGFRRKHKLFDIIETLASLCQNFVPALVAQLLYSGRAASGELKFQESTAKSILKHKLPSIGIMTDMVTILKHDCLILSTEMAALLKNMNLIPALALCLSSKLMLQSPNFLKLFLAIRELLVTLLSTKGGIIYFCKDQAAVRQLIKCLDQIADEQRKYHELIDESLHEIFEEENLPGVLDNTELVERVIQKVKLRNPLFLESCNKDSIWLRILAHQLSSTIKYMVVGVNLLDTLYKKQTDNDYGVEFLNALNQVSHIAIKTRVSNQALRCLSCNDIFHSLFIGIMSTESVEDAQMKHAELAMTCDILHQVYSSDNGKNLLQNAEALSKAMNSLTKVMESKTVENDPTLGEGSEFRSSFKLLKSYLDPIILFSQSSVNTDIIMILMMKFNTECRYTSTVKPTQSTGKPSTGHHKSESLLLTQRLEDNKIVDELLYWGHLQKPDSHICFIDNCLNIFNIMIAYNKNTIINFLQKDLFSGICNLISSLTVLLDRLISEDEISCKLDFLLTSKVQYINSYLQVLTKALVLVDQRLDHRVATEENAYENTELISCYLDIYVSCINLMNEDQLTLNGVKLNQNALLVLSNVVLSGLGTWIELNDMGSTVIYIAFYKAFTSLINRNALLFLLSSLVSISSTADKGTFAMVHKTLTSPFDFKKTENRFPKDPEKKEKKFPTTKLQMVEKFYEEIVGKDTSLLAYVLNLAVEKNFFTLFSFVESIFEQLLNVKEYKITLSVYQIIDKEFKGFSENLKEFLGEDLAFMRRFGKLCLLIEKLSKIPTFKSFVLFNDYTIRFRKIVHAIEDELNTNLGFKNISMEKVQLLQHLKETVLKTLTICCKQSIGLNVPEHLKDQTLSAENIPQISQVQDILRSTYSFLTLPKTFLNLYGISESEDPSDKIEEETREDFIHRINSLKTTLEIIKNLSENVFGQIVILYTEYSKIVPSKPNTIVSFHDIYHQLTKILAKNDSELLRHDFVSIEILQNMLSSVYWLCHNPATTSFLASDRRKAAIRSLIFENKANTKGGSTKVSQINGSQLVESFEKLQKIVREKAQYLTELSVIHNSEGRALVKAIQSLQKCDFILGSLVKYTTATVDAKKEMDKNPEIPAPRDLEQRFKEIEEKDSNKTIRKELSKQSNHPTTALGFWFARQVLADVLQKLNAPFTATKRARVINIARDQIGFIEPVVESYGLSQSNNYEVIEWDFDSKTALTSSTGSIAQRANGEHGKELPRVDLEPIQGLHGKKKVIRQSMQKFLKNEAKELQLTNEAIFFQEVDNLDLTKHPKASTRIEERIASLLKKKQIEFEPKIGIYKPIFLSVHHEAQEHHKAAQARQQQQLQANLQNKAHLGSRQPSTHVDTFLNMKFYPQQSPVGMPRVSDITPLQKSDSNPAPSLNALMSNQSGSKQDFQQFNLPNLSNEEPKDIARAYSTPVPSGGLDINQNDPSKVFGNLFPQNAQRQHIQNPSPVVDDKQSVNKQQNPLHQQQQDSAQFFNSQLYKAQTPITPIKSNLSGNPNSANQNYINPRYNQNSSYSAGAGSGFQSNNQFSQQSPATGINNIPGVMQSPLGFVQQSPGMVGNMGLPQQGGNQMQIGGAPNMMGNIMQGMVQQSQQIPQNYQPQSQSQPGSTTKSPSVNSTAALRDLLLQSLNPGANMMQNQQQQHIQQQHLHLQQPLHVQQQPQQQHYQHFQQPSQNLPPQYYGERIPEDLSKQSHHPQMMMDMQGQQQPMQNTAAPQDHGAPINQESPNKGKALTIEDLTEEEKRVLKGIMENTNKNDPRFAQKIKKAMQKHPRIFEFLKSQKKNI